MERLRSKLTYANVMATIAVFIARFSYAAIKLPKNSVGTRQIKNGAVTGTKLGKGAVSASNVAPGVIPAPINPATLGTVPSATNAAHATSADSADSATNAAHATNADTVQGQTAAQIAASARPSCPTETTEAVGLCFENSTRGLDVTFTESRETCAQAGRLLPSTAQLEAFRDVTGTHSTVEWAGQQWYDGSQNRAPDLYAEGSFGEQPITSELPTDARSLRPAESSPPTRLVA